MTATATVHSIREESADTVQARADAYRIMEDADRATMRRAWRQTYEDRLAERKRLDAEIDAGENEILAIQQRINGLAIERSSAHRDVVKATRQLAALEEAEGR